MPVHLLCLIKGYRILEFLKSFTFHPKWLPGPISVIMIIESESLSR